MTGGCMTSLKVLDSPFEDAKRGLGNRGDSGKVGHDSWAEVAVIIVVCIVGEVLSIACCLCFSGGM